jgi:hypothetical protein
MHTYQLNYGTLLYWYDFILAPIYIFLLIKYTKSTTYRKYSNTPAQKYIMPALYARILGCVLSAFMYQYYYGAGDTYVYFNMSLELNKILFSNVGEGLSMLFTDPENYTPLQWSFLRGTTGVYEFNSPDVSIVCKIGSILHFFTFRSYLCTGLILTYFSFLSCWKLFLVFYELYPKIHKQIAISTLFIPSVFFWGAAGLMKDTITMACIGYFTYGVYYFFIKRKNLITSFFQITVSFYLMFSIKIYIAIAFIPALIVWVFLIYRHRIKDRTLKILATPIFLLIGLLLAGYIYQQVSSVNERYSQEKIIKSAMIVQQYLKKISEKQDGSGYDLGEIDPSPMGVLAVAPKAINVTLFRPYFWEIRKPILMASALEAFIFLIFTIYIFYSTGIKTTLRYIITDPNVLFCLTFALLFSFAVGFSTYNFGTLARYKIPAIPFYFLALFILYNKKLKNT